MENLNSNHFLELFIIIIPFLLLHYETFIFSVLVLNVSQLKYEVFARPFSVFLSRFALSHELSNPVQTE